MPVKNIVTDQKIDPEKLRRARELRREMTPAERRLWQALRSNRLGGFHFRRQQIISGFIVDFHCHAADLVVELDGDIHLSQRENDAERGKVLSEAGLRVYRFRNEQVMEDLQKVLRIILEACRDTELNARA